MVNKFYVGDAVKINYFGRIRLGRYYGIDEFSEFMYGKTPKVIVITPLGEQLITSFKYLEKLQGRELEKFTICECLLKSKNKTAKLYGGLIKQKTNDLEK